MQKPGEKVVSFIMPTHKDPENIKTDNNILSKGFWANIWQGIRNFFGK
jgi:hypothetical protein